MIRWDDTRHDAMQMYRAQHGATETFGTTFDKGNQLAT